MAELTDLVLDLATKSVSWSDRVVPDPDERQYARVLRTEHVEVWVVAWMAGHDIGFHGHDDAGAA